MVGNPSGVPPPQAFRPEVAATPRLNFRVVRGQQRAETGPTNWDLSTQAGHTPRSRHNFARTSALEVFGCTS